MTIKQYQESEYSQQLAELLKQPALQMALALCAEHSPGNGGNRNWDQPHLAHIQLGLDRGYNLYPQVLKLLATRPEKQEEEPTTYAPVEELTHA